MVHTLSEAERLLASRLGLKLPPLYTTSAARHRRKAARFPSGIETDPLIGPTLRSAAAERLLASRLGLKRRVTNPKLETPLMPKGCSLPVRD